LSSPRRGGAFAASLLALLCAALVLPAVGAAETYTSPASSSLTIQGPKVKNFKFSGGAFASAAAGPTMPARGGASFTLARGGAANRESHSHFSLPMGKLKLGKNLSSGSWKSDFGSVGKVNLKFRPTKALRSVKPFKGCKGPNSQSRVGKVSGSLKVDMGAYFKTVKLKSARAVAAKSPQRECDFTEGGTGADAVSLFAGNEGASFNASKSGGKVTQQMFVSDGPIQRSLTRTTTSGDDFTHAGDASSASVKGGGSFSGTLSYTAQSYYEGGSSGSVTGDLTAKFVTGAKTVQAGPAGSSSLRVPGFVPPNKVPTADFYSSQSFGTLDVRFFDGSYDSDGTIASRSWNFGDGSTSTEASPTHTYAAAGTYTVTLTVTDDRGGTATKTEQVVVEAAEEF
jgi:PKD repeat protein